MSASFAPEVHTFWPLTTHSPPSRTAVVRRPARSEPAPGSLYNKHMPTSSSKSLRRYNDFISSLPYDNNVPAHKFDLSCPGPGTPAVRKTFSTSVAASSSSPRPNHSVGQRNAAHFESTTNSRHAAKSLLEFQFAARKAFASCTVSFILCPPLFVMK